MAQLVNTAEVMVAMPDSTRTAMLSLIQANWGNVLERQKYEDQIGGVLQSERMARHTVALSKMMGSQSWNNGHATSIQRCGGGDFNYSSRLIAMKRRLALIRADQPLSDALRKVGLGRLTKRYGDHGNGRREYDLCAGISFNLCIQQELRWTEPGQLVLGVGQWPGEYEGDWQAAPITSVQQEWGLLHRLVERGMATDDTGFKEMGAAFAAWQQEATGLLPPQYPPPAAVSKTLVVKPLLTLINRVMDAYKFASVIYGNRDLIMQELPILHLASYARLEGDAPAERWINNRVIEVAEVEVRQRETWQLSRRPGAVVNEQPRLLGEQTNPPAIQRDEKRAAGSVIRSYGRVPATAYYGEVVRARTDTEEQSSARRVKMATALANDVVKDRRKRKKEKAKKAQRLAKRMALLRGRKKSKARRTDKWYKDCRVAIADTVDKLLPSDEEEEVVRATRGREAANEGGVVPGRTSVATTTRPAPVFFNTRASVPQNGEGDGYEPSGTDEGEVEVSVAGHKRKRGHENWMSTNLREARAKKKFVKEYLREEIVERLSKTRGRTFLLSARETVVRFPVSSEEEGSSPSTEGGGEGEDEATAAGDDGGSSSRGAPRRKQ